MNEIVSPRASIQVIQEHVARAFGISRADILGSAKTRAIARPRQVAMFLSAHMSGQSLPAIGRAFRRDHSTVLHAVKKVPDHLSREPELRSLVESLRRSIPADFAPAPGASLAQSQAEARNAVVRRVKSCGDGAVVGSVDEIRAALKEMYGEVPVSRGWRRTARVEILVSPQGSWSLIEINRFGNATLILHGTEWQGPTKAARTHLCLKCHARPVQDDYPGLCDECRESNGGIAPLAEGMIG